VKKFNIDSFHHEAGAGAPAPPKWNPRSALVCESKFEGEWQGLLRIQFFPPSRQGPWWFCYELNEDLPGTNIPLFSARD
jgi:hypothetical protein